MAIPHARPGQPVSIHSDPLSLPQTTTLIKTESIEVIRVVMSKGKELGTSQGAWGDYVAMSCGERHASSRRR